MQEIFGNSDGLTVKRAGYGWIGCNTIDCIGLYLLLFL